MAETASLGMIKHSRGNAGLALVAGGWRGGGSRENCLIKPRAGLSLCSRTLSPLGRPSRGGRGSLAPPARVGVRQPRLLCAGGGGEGFEPELGGGGRGQIPVGAQATNGVKRALNAKAAWTPRPEQGESRGCLAQRSPLAPPPPPPRGPLSPFCLQRPHSHWAGTLSPPWEKGADPRRHPWPSPAPGRGGRGRPPLSQPGEQAGWPQGRRSGGSSSSSSRRGEGGPGDPAAEALACGPWPRPSSRAEGGCAARGGRGGGREAATHGLGGALDPGGRRSRRAGARLWRQTDTSVISALSNRHASQALDAPLGLQGGGRAGPRTHEGTPARKARTQGREGGTGTSQRRLGGAPDWWLWQEPPFPEVGEKLGWSLSLVSGAARGGGAGAQATLAASPGSPPVPSWQPGGGGLAEGLPQGQLLVQLGPVGPSSLCGGPRSCSGHAQGEGPPFVGCKCPPPPAAVQGCRGAQHHS